MTESSSAERLPSRACGPVSAGLYIDDRPKLATTERYIERVVAIGYDHACIMLDGPGDQLHDVKWSESQLRLFCELTSQLQRTGRPFSRVLTIWAEPTREYIRQLREKLPTLVRAAGATALELDLEGGWDPRRAREGGFASIHDAGLALVDAIRETLEGTRLEIVTWRARWSAVKAILPHARRVTAMIYPRRHREVRGQTIEIASDDKRQGPRFMVGLELDLLIGKLEALAPPLRPELSAALPAWDQTWPDLTPLQAMRLERAQAVDRGVTTLRDWSSKWILGVRKNTYAARALAELYAI